MHLFSLEGGPIPGWLRSIHHDGSEAFVSNPHPRLGEKIHLKLRCAQNAPVSRVYIRTSPDGEQAFRRMEPAGQSSPVQWWQTSLTVRQPTLHYRFLIQSTQGVWWFTAAGISAFDPLDNTDFQILADAAPMEWLTQSVFYQIFPDRFANGEQGNDPRPEEFEYRGYQPKTYDWEAQPDPEQPFSLIYYGGDLQGITQRLDYLQSLGVTALYLNPIFSAHSNHKYDVIDYENVDPHFGGNAALIELRQALTARGMRYILDIVPNHCGYWHPWFQTARSDRGSLEADFFTFTQHPDEYVSWLGVWSLPKLNYSSFELRRRIYMGQEAVFRRWLRPPFQADGWRIDVANMLGRQGATQISADVGREIRKAVKETHPDAYLLGENFFDASAQLQGDQWDGVMNYAGFTLPLWHWLRGYQQGAWGLRETIRDEGVWPTPSLEESWRIHRAALPYTILLQQFNILDSHDTQRIRSITSGNDALHRLAAMLQFTYPGVPCLYYGDEIGMQEHPNLAQRGCMVWDETSWDQSLLGFYRDLISLRKQSAALQRGGFQMLSIEEDFFAFQREASSGQVVVTAQRSLEPREARRLPVDHGGIADGTHFFEAFSGQETVVENGSLQLPEHPQGAFIWVQRS